MFADYTAVIELRKEAEAILRIGSEHQRQAALLRKQAWSLCDNIAQALHKQLADAFADDVLIWASAPSGEEAWGVVDYSLSSEEPFFGVNYFDGDKTVGVCGANFTSVEEAVAFAQTKPPLNYSYDTYEV